MERRNDGYTAIEDQYAGYTVYDQDGDKIGKVDDLFLDENDRPEYIGVKMGFLGLKSTLIPMDSVHEDQERQGLVVNQEKSVVKDAPTFDDDEEITPEFEERVRGHYGLGAREGGGQEQQRGGYGGYYGDDDDTGRRGDTDLDTDETRSGARMGDREGGDREGVLDRDREGDLDRDREGDLDRDRDREGLGATARDDDEIRVQRSEEELRAGTREREAGRMNVRKRVRTEREQVRVPTRREEVTVDRVPVDEEATAGVEIGEEEVEIPVVEEEVVVEKKPVVKEEIRLRKESVQEEEVVEEDVRKEEVDIDDQTTTRGGDRGMDRDLDDDEGRRRDR